MVLESYAAQEVNPPTCAKGRELERVGERWSILILREPPRGYPRCDGFPKSVPIAPIS